MGVEPPSLIPPGPSRKLSRLWTLLLLASGDRLGGCRRRLDRDREDDDLRVELQPKYSVELPGR